MGICYVIKNESRIQKFYVITIVINETLAKKTGKKYSKLLIVNILKVGYRFHTFLYFYSSYMITSMILKIRYTLNLRKKIIFVLERKKGVLKEQNKHLFCIRNYITVNYHSTPKI